MRSWVVGIAALAAVLVAAPADARPDVDARSSAMLGRLVVPAIGVDARIVPVGVTGRGELAVGRSVRDVYRWRDGVVPGQYGSAVLAGHTWSRGRGVFDRLGRLVAGDRIVVGTNRFEVTRVRRVTDMTRSQVRALFSDRGRPRLVLITCGDRDTSGVYRTRIVVNARRLAR